MFAANAGSLAGMAGALLGWRPDEFWQATPAELLAILQSVAGDGGQVVTASSDDLARLKEMFPDG